MTYSVIHGQIGNVGLKWIAGCDGYVNWRIDGEKNKAGYTATEVACWWAGAIFEVTRPFGQGQWGQKNKFMKKSKT